MPDLRRASFAELVLSYFRPKRLEVQIRTAVLSNGDYGLKPVFLIDGNEVPGDEITPDSTQKVLGRYVRLDEQARKVLDLTKGRTIRLAKSKAADLLDGLSKKGVQIRSRDGKASVQLKKAKPDVSLELTPDDTLRISSQLVTSEGKVIGKPKDIQDLRQENGWHADGDDLIRVDLTHTPLDKVLLQEGGTGTLEGDEVPRFLKTLAAQASHVGEVEKDESLASLAVFSASGSNRLNVSGNEEFISVEPKLTFTTSAGVAYEYSEQELPELEKKAGGFDRIEEGWIEVDSTVIDGFKAARNSLRQQTGGEERIEGADIPKLLTDLAEQNRGRSAQQTPWNVYYTKAVADAHRLCDQPSSLEFRLNIVESDGKALLHLDPVYSHDRFRLNHSEVENAVDSGDEWVRRPGAWVHVDADRYSKVSRSASQLALQRTGDGYSFPAANRERVIEIFSKLGSIRQSETYADFLAKLHDFERIEEVPLPGNVKHGVSLRAYQQHGLNWLAFLQRFSLNGILADDMGLGKTLQTLTVIERARELSQSRLPALIICPASVMLNWRSEILKFLQRTDVVVYHGTSRQNVLGRIKEAVGPRSRIRSGLYVITSYDTARIDCDDLNRIPWLYVVVDEGHNLKNPDAQRTRAIKTIAGQHKLALTGTPIQNKLEELWSLFDFAMPGYLGTRSSFRQRYSTGNRIDMNAVEQTLKPRIKPFYLRRLKADVAKDLPEKIIVDTSVELTPRQVKLYKQAISGSEYRKLVEELNAKGVGRSQPHILAVLTKLRNICNHPVLLKDEWEPSEAKVEESGKLHHLQELMEEVIESDHRALFFSQSTRVLDIVEHHFADWGIRSLRIDGDVSPARRDALAKQFNEDKQINCFLLSTKAAGVGLNLPGADTVIFYDHDWNPANDNQAMDRAHRIGQTKTVTIYRLISKGTIEEKILERQKKKQKLADVVIGSDELGFKALTKEELLDLFRFDEDSA
jgi:superfamily II DNA or RNA helicase